jgi:site-specific DNA-adenine methylase
VRRRTLDVGDKARASCHRLPLAGDWQANIGGLKAPIITRILQDVKHFLNLTIDTQIGQWYTGNNGDQIMPINYRGAKHVAIEPVLKILGKKAPFQRWIEPFAGSGGSLLRAKQAGMAKQYFAGDTNPEMVRMLGTLLAYPDEVKKAIPKVYKAIGKLAEATKKGSKVTDAEIQALKTLEQNLPEDPIERAAAHVILGNRAYRYVPGVADTHYATGIRTSPQGMINKLTKLTAGDPNQVRLAHGSWKDTLKALKPGKGDVVLSDPPYLSTKGYNQGWTSRDTDALSDALAKAQARGAKVVAYDSAEGAKMYPKSFKWTPTPSKTNEMIAGLPEGSKVFHLGKKGYVAFSPAMVKLASYVADNILRGGFTKEELQRIEAGEVDLSETPLVESAVNTRKFVMMARALPELLKHSHRGMDADSIIRGHFRLMAQAVGDWSKHAGTIAAKQWKQVGEIPPEMFRDIEKIQFQRLPGSTLGDYVSKRFHNAPIDRIRIDPAKAYLYPKENVARHEFAHAKQFAERATPPTLNASDLAYLDAAARSTKLGPAVSYLDEPFEIHARAVERSKKPFMEAYRASEELMASEFRKFLADMNKMLKDVPLKEKVKHMSRATKEVFVPWLRIDVRDLIQKGVLSAGGATAGVQILNKGSDE